MMDRVEDIKRGIKNFCRSKPSAFDDLCYHEQLYLIRNVDRKMHLEYSEETLKKMFGI